MKGDMKTINRRESVAAGFARKVGVGLVRALGD